VPASSLALLYAGLYCLLLHFRRQTAQVCDYPSADLPLGILPEQTFGARDVQCEAGDVLLLLTDGITETSDKHGAELGVNAIKSGLQRWADLPLPELFRNIRDSALRFGKQEDDQTMLLVRRLSANN
jgi:phosphoserine phosphatase RsbU/P